MRLPCAGGGVGVEVPLQYDCIAFVVQCSGGNGHIYAENGLRVSTKAVVHAGTETPQLEWGWVNCSAPSSTQSEKKLREIHKVKLAFPGCRIVQEGPER
jgi:hypothetical protein